MTFSSQYLSRFELREREAHAELLAVLHEQSPIQYVLLEEPDGLVRVTVLSFNYAYVFSLITGALSSQGFHILSGEAFTEMPQEVVARRRFFSEEESGRRQLNRTSRSVSRRKIIDVFTGKIPDNIAFRVWRQQLGAFLDNLFQQLAANRTEDAVAMVNQAVVQRLSQMTTREKQLFPVVISVDNDTAAATRLTLVTQDTPMFLYAIAQALAMQGLSIEHLTIQTHGAHVEDVFEILDRSGQKIIDETVLDQIRLLTLLTKQFTYFLDKAPNPYDALSRFGKLIKSVADMPEKKQWLQFLSDSRALSDMAKVLGTSDSLWEDMIRLHLESLLPVLSARLQDHPIYEQEHTLGSRLEEALAGQSDKKQALNRFKDQEMFLIDLNHILGRSDLTVLSKQLTHLVQEVLKATLRLVWEGLIVRYGVPMGFGDVPTQWALMGLGKLGGEALGYASDIELMLIYGDAGYTQGPESIGNDVFFGFLIQGLTQYIDGKRDGIFEIDLRLRPYGKDGPLAVQLAQFCQYFGFSGPAHSYERLALVPMRTVGGSRSFGKKIERLRNQYVYECHFPCESLWALRRKQYQEKVQGSEVNLKYSPGALVDLEYAVQMLQIVHAQQHESLKTPHIREALVALGELGVMPDDQVSLLQRAYLFFRHVINGLRMLRGSAHDLALPVIGSPEFAFLAKRIGYEQTPEMGPAQQLFSEVQTYMAAVRAFVDGYFSRESLPEQTANIADFVFSDQVPVFLREQVFGQLGFKNVLRAYANIRRLAEKAHDKAMFAQLSVLAAGYLTGKADPDMALNNWERLVAHLDHPDAHFSALMRQPSRLDIMMDLFSVSQFLSDSVIKDPEILHWASEPHRLRRRRKRGELTADLAILSQAQPDTQVWLSVLRRFRRRELLRIAIRDVSLHMPLTDIVRDISLLAEALSQAALQRIWQTLALTDQQRQLQETFCLLAMGKLGATELNYSSDIDLIPVYDDVMVAALGIEDADARQVFDQVLRAFQSALTSYTSEGRAYRMDFNLRPYGSAGEWVTSMSQLVVYYEKAASLWELQALIKMRPLAGAWPVGFLFLHRVCPIVKQNVLTEKVAHNIHKMRQETLKQLSKKGLEKRDIKNGDGGIRDIEFLVQGIQLMHIGIYPQLQCRATLVGLHQIQVLGLLPSDVCVYLREYYLLFRRLEHFLQLFEDQQVHSLPDTPSDQLILAKRLFGESAEPEELQEKVGVAMACIAEMRRSLLSSQH